MRQNDSDKERSILLRSIGVATACGADLAFMILVGVLAGHFIDTRFHSTPWGLLIGLFIGLGAGMYTAYLIIAPLLRSM